MKTRRGGVRVAVAGWGMAAVLLVTACSGDDGDGADAESAGGGDVEVSTEGEATQDAAAVAQEAEDAGEVAAEEALGETEVVGADVPDGFPEDQVPLADGMVNIGVTDMGSGDVYTAVIAGDGVVDAQIAALEQAGWQVESDTESDNADGSASVTTIYYVQQGEWTVDLTGFGAGFNVEGAPEQVAVNVWPAAYDK